MATTSVIAFLQPGIQPGLKARSGGETGENPFAALLASLGIEVAPADGVSAIAATAAAQTGVQAATETLSAPLQLLKDIGEAIAAALEEGTELPDFDQLPPEFQSLLAQFAQLPDELHRSLETLIGTDAVAALDELAAKATVGAPATPAPTSSEGAADQATGTANAGNPPVSGQNNTAAPATSAAAPQEQSAPASAAAPAPASAPSPDAPATASGRNETPAQPASAPAAQRPAPQTANAGPAPQAQAAVADDAAPAANAQTASTTATDGDTQPLANAPAKPPAPATQAAAAAVVNAATPSRVQQQASGAAANTAAPSSEDAARAQTAAGDTKRTGLRGLLETLAAGPQATESSPATPHAHARQELAAAIQAAVAARSGGNPASDAAKTASTDGVDLAAGKSDPILLTADRPGQTAFASAPARSVTVPAYGSSLPVAQLAVTISTQARAGTRHFDIRLDPPEMGRIDVRLEMTRDGVLNAQLTVDRPETFDALNRDARNLERMLQQSGMKLDGSSIQFSLRDGGGSGNGQGFEGQAGGGSGGNDSAPAADAETDVSAPAYARIPSSALVDIEV